MLEITLSTNRLRINTVTNVDYLDILRFYKDKRNYYYATGENENIDIDILNSKIMSKSVDNYFFCTARLITENINIGCISGFVDKAKGLLWIYMLIVDVKYQRLGYGKEIFRSVFIHLSEYFYINAVLIGVANENIKGQSFWEKQGFSLYKLQNNAQTHKIYILYAFV